MKQLKYLLNGDRAYRIVVIIFLTVCIITGVFCFQYYNHLQDAIRQESRGYLQEISKQISSNINRIIGDNYASMNTVASVLEGQQLEDFSSIMPIIKSQQRYWNYQDVLVIDKGGLAYDTKGNTVSLNHDTQFNHAITNGEQGICTTQLVDNRECIMLVVPINGLLVGDREIIALATSYNPSVFEQVLSMTAFNGQAFSCVINQTGTLVIRSTGNNGLQLGYNVLSTIGESKMENGHAMKQVKDDIQGGKQGQIGFYQGDIRYYMVYTPVNTEGWYLLSFVPATAVNQNSDNLLQITLALCGLITAAFAGLIAFLVFTSYRNKQKLEYIAYVDEVTGGSTIQHFYKQAELELRQSNHPEYVLVYTNMQKFKLMNEQFGSRNGDLLLHAFHKAIEQNLKNKECIGRISADNFCVLLEYSNEAELLERFKIWFENGEAFVNTNKPAWSLPVVEFGIFVIANDTIPFPQIIDRAKLALKEFPRSVNSRLRYAIYNDQVHQKLFREKYLEDMMEKSLLEGEFQVYLQPKYLAGNGKIGGAEALTRWISKSEGMIFPDEFIPLFERNSFIVQLDLYIFEQVCKRIRHWIDEGLTPVKISVNCSRVQLKNTDFLRSYRKISEQYAIPPSLIELELTESVVMEDVTRLGKVIDDIHALGFGCSMDDFGSGYSSLNMIQSISVDTLKLDKIFFRNNSKDPARMESVVSSIITMAKALSMQTVAEGVEYADQVEMLKRIGCDYIQGFVFAKPMPIDAFEQIMYGNPIKEE